MLGTTLVDMYAKCGSLVKAAQVLDQLPVRNVVSWNALLAGYVQQGQGEEALNCFELMQSEGVYPDGTTFIYILNACSSIGAAVKGEEIHQQVVRWGLLEKDVVLANTLVDMYAKCGALAKAAQVLHELPVRNVVSWNALITAYAQQGQGEEALTCFEQMQSEGLFPNTITFICILKACGSIGAADKGKHIHDDIVRQGLLEKDIVLGTALVGMYAKCGELATAAQVLNELTVRNAVSWNALISGYVLWGQGEKALKSFNRMESEGFSPDAVTFICILKACGSIGAVEKGERIHNEITRQGLLRKDIVLANSLVDMYAKCGAIAKAARVLDELPVRNVVTWNALLAGYAEEGQGEEALNSFGCMLREGVSPDTITFICILKACSIIGRADKGEQIHREIVRLGLLVEDVVLGNALVDMYAKCDALMKAASVHDDLPVRNIVSWNTLIAGYTQHGKAKEALICLERMQGEGISPDVVTFTCILKACGSIGATDKGNEIHDDILRQGLLEKDVILGTTLVDMYVKFGFLAKAARVLDELPVWDAVAWSALMAGYTNQGQGVEALKRFEWMQREGLSPDTVAFACILKACGHVGAANKGELIHNEIVRRALLQKDVVIGNALVEMYAKCGALANAAQVLYELPVWNIVSWSALIAGYAQQGRGGEALKCFEQMQCKGFSPDMVSWSSVLSACSRSGLLDEGQMFYMNLSTKHGIIPELEHHTCMVNLLGRAGEFEKALAVIKKMPLSDHTPVWHALLAGCRECRNVKLGTLAFDSLQLDKNIMFLKND